METKNNIKKLREAAGLNVLQLAEKSGVPYRTIYQWENGERKPRDVYQLRKLAVALGVTIEDLIIWEDSHEKD